MTSAPAQIRADARIRSGWRKGQAMVETVVVMFFLCLVFFLVYEYANLLTAHTVVNYAAARAARARTVGFNDFMVTKTVRVATASVAGKCLSQDDFGDELSTGTIVSRMGSYLEAENEADTKGDRRRTQGRERRAHHARLAAPSALRRGRRGAPRSPRRGRH